MIHVGAIGSGLVIGFAFQHDWHAGLLALVASLLAGVAGYKTERTP